MSGRGEISRPPGGVGISLEDAIRGIVLETVESAVPSLPGVVSREKMRDLLGINERTLKTLIGKGLPRLKHGHLTFFEPERVFEWLREGATT